MDDYKRITYDEWNAMINTIEHLSKALETLTNDYFEHISERH